MTHEQLLAYLHMVGCELRNLDSLYCSAIYPGQGSPFDFYWSVRPDRHIYVVYTNQDRTEIATPDEVYNLARQAITQYLQEQEL